MNLQANSKTASVLPRATSVSLTLWTFQWAAPSQGTRIRQNRRECSSLRRDTRLLNSDPAARTSSITRQCLLVFMARMIFEMVFSL